MKFFLCLFILIFFTTLGYIYATKFKNRKIFYNDFCNFNKILKNEISFSQKTIIDIVENIDLTTTFNTITNKYFKNDKKNIEKLNYLKDDEHSFFISYLKSIGTGDKISQLEYLRYVDEILGEKIKNCENDYCKYYFTSIKMGFLIGLIAFVFLI